MAISRRSKAYRAHLSLGLLGLIAPLPVSAKLEDVARSYALSSRQEPIILTPRASSHPLIIENLCDETIWPAIASQTGTGPSTSGFSLDSGSTKSLSVSSNWQGRVWGRTNCSFNAAGNGPANANGGKACATGDCNGVLGCILTGDPPVTLFEALMGGGSANNQDFYDISLVDGYNLPIGITYLPGNNSALSDIPPNLTNAACIGTAGWLTDGSSASTNGTYPLPYDTATTNADLQNWCPWNLQLNAPTKPGDGVYPYPDDNIQRPIFDPCNSACAATNSAADCCTGEHGTPSTCTPSLYSNQAKSVCPDAYSYAYDDTTSTFIIPTGGGYHVTFCPAGRSTNILKTFGKQLDELASTGKVSSEIISDAQNVTLIQRGDAASEVGGERRKLGSLGAMVVVVAWLCFW